ncbi:hypothetical protein HK098_003327 [Nowakowskiella sp. JEL0407]|nr:hypothetical protein HK098_003327 [Nowakowskiella sp. JEL0407]
MLSANFRQTEFEQTQPANTTSEPLPGCFNPINTYLPPQPTESTTPKPPTVEYAHHIFPDLLSTTSISTIPSNNSQMIKTPESPPSFLQNIVGPSTNAAGTTSLISSDSIAQKTMWGISLSSTDILGNIVYSQPVDQGLMSGTPVQETATATTATTNGTTKFQTPKKNLPRLNIPAIRNSVQHQQQNQEYNVDTGTISAYPNLPYTHPTSSTVLSAAPETPITPFSAYPTTETGGNLVISPDRAIRTKKFRRMVAAINDIVVNKLYKSKSQSLEAYFKDNWNMSRAQVYRLVDCGIVLKQLHDLPLLPTRERICRSLKKLAKNKHDMRALWEAVLSRVSGNPDSVSSNTITTAWDELKKAKIVTGTTVSAEDDGLPNIFGDRDSDAEIEDDDEDDVVMKLTELNNAVAAAAEVGANGSAGGGGNGAGKDGDDAAGVSATTTTVTTPTMKGKRKRDVLSGVPVEVEEEAAPPRQRYFTRHQQSILQAEQTSNSPLSPTTTTPTRESVSTTKRRRGGQSAAAPTQPKISASREKIINDTVNAVLNSLDSMYTMGYVLQPFVDGKWLETPVVHWRFAPIKNSGKGDATMEEKSDDENEVKDESEDDVVGRDEEVEKGAEAIMQLSEACTSALTEFIGESRTLESISSNQVNEMMHSSFLTVTTEQQYYTPPATGNQQEYFISSSPVHVNQQPQFQLPVLDQHIQYQQPNSSAMGYNLGATVQQQQTTPVQQVLQITQPQQPTYLSFQTVEQLQSQSGYAQTMSVNPFHEKRGSGGNHVYVMSGISGGGSSNLPTISQLPTLNLVDQPEISNASRGLQPAVANYYQIQQPQPQVQYGTVQFESPVNFVNGSGGSVNDGGNATYQYVNSTQQRHQLAPITNQKFYESGQGMFEVDGSEVRDGDGVNGGGEKNDVVGKDDTGIAVAAEPGIW